MKSKISFESEISDFNLTFNTPKIEERYQNYIFKLNKENIILL